MPSPPKRSGLEGATTSRSPEFEWQDREKSDAVAGESTALCAVTAHSPSVPDRLSATPENCQESTESVLPGVDSWEDTEVWDATSLEASKPTLDWLIDYSGGIAMLAPIQTRQRYRMFRYEGLLGSRKIQVALDTGAEENLVSSATVKALGLKIAPLKPGMPQYTVLPDGKCLPTLGVLSSTKLRIGDYVERVEDLEMIVVDVRGFDVILGMPWCTKYNVDFDFRTSTTSFPFTDEKGSTYLVSLVPGVQHRDADSRFMSIKAAMRCAEEGELFCCLIRSAAEDSSETVQLPEQEIVDYVSELKTKYQDVVTDCAPSGVPAEGRIQHEIHEVEGSRPVFRNTYRMSDKEHEELLKQLQDLLDKGFIRPSTSPYGAPVLFAKKPGGGLRLCIDYRALNQQTIQNRFPLPRVDTALDQLKGAQYFSKLDLTAGYHQIRMAEKDIHKTAFNTRYGHYEFLVMPFGLTNAPATFQTLMNDVFKDFLEKFVIVYLDDILIYSKTLEEHKEHVELVLETLRRAKLTAKLSKCEFFTQDTVWVGHRLTKDGVAVDPSKVKAVREWPAPSNKKELMQFLGLANYCRRFIQHYASITAPLTDLLGSSVVYTWGAEQQEAFEKLKHALTNAPVMKSPDPDRPYLLYTDASVVAVGAVLMQDFGNGPQPIAYESKKLSNQERVYPTHDRELLSIVYALRKWRHYLYRADMRVLNDHRSLGHFIGQQRLNDRQVRWLALLADYQLKIEYVQGVANVVADALSRRPGLEDNEGVDNLHMFSAVTLEEGETAVADQSFPCFAAVYAVSIDPELVLDVKAAYGADTHCKKLIDGVLKGKNKDYVYADGLLYKKSGKDNQRLVIPKDDTLLTKLMVAHHDSIVAGHLGRDKTLARLKENFYWYGMDKDVELYVQTCDLCQQNKPSNKKQFGLLQPLPIPDHPWQWVTMDFITQLPLSSAGFDAIAVFVDKLTKMVHFVPMKTTDNAANVARIFFDAVFRLHGLPDHIVSDRDPRFVSSFWQNLWKLLGTDLMMSTSYHPQTDGQTERVNRVLEEYLRAFVNNGHDNWHEYLSAAEFTINSAKQVSTGKSPFELNSAVTPRGPASFLNPSGRKKGRSKKRSEEVAEDFIKDLQQAIADAKKNLVKAQQRQKAYADLSRRAHRFEAGQFVLVEKSQFRLAGDGPSHKLNPEYVGPFKILKVVNTNALKLELPNSMNHHHVVNVSKCVEYNDTDRFADRPRQQTDPEAVGVKRGEKLWVVDKFLKVRNNPPRHKRKHGPRKYLVRWLGYGPQHDEWRPETSLRDDLGDEIFEAFVADMST